MDPPTLMSESDCLPEVLGISSITQLLLSKIFGRKTLVPFVWDEISKCGCGMMVGSGQAVFMGVKF